MDPIYTEWNFNNFLVKYMFWLSLHQFGLTMKTGEHRSTSSVYCKIEILEFSQPNLHINTIYGEISGKFRWFLRCQNIAPPCI